MNDLFYNLTLKSDPRLILKLMIKIKKFFFIPLTRIIILKKLMNK